MTVQSNNPVVNYTGNGVTTSFNAPSNCISPPLVILTDNTIPASPVVRTLVLSSDYTLTSVGGMFVTVSLFVAPTASKVLTVQLNEPFTQLTHWVEGDPFPAASHEAAADHAVLLAQQLQGQIQNLTTPGLTTAQILAPLASTAAGQGDALIAGLRSEIGAQPFTLDVFNQNRPINVVTDYLAKGDGVTDDTAAFQAAITAAIINNVTLEVPPTAKYYKIAGNLSITHGLHILGLSSGLADQYFGSQNGMARLVFTGTGIGINIPATSTDGPFGITLENLTLQGNANMTYGVKMAGTASFTGAFFNLVHCMVYGFTTGYGASIYYCTSNVIDRCVFETCGVALQLNNAHDTTIIRSNLEQSLVGLDAIACNAISIFGGAIQGCNYGRVTSQSLAMPSSFNIYGGWGSYRNSLALYAGTGIRVQGCNLIVNGLYIEGNTWSCLLENTSAVAWLGGYLEIDNSANTTGDKGGFDIHDGSLYLRGTYAVLGAQGAGYVGLVNQNGAFYGAPVDVSFATTLGFTTAQVLTGGGIPSQVGTTAVFEPAKYRLLAAKAHVFQNGNDQQLTSIVTTGLPQSIDISANANANKLWAVISGGGAGLVTFNWLDAETLVEGTEITVTIISSGSNSFAFGAAFRTDAASYAMTTGKTMTFTFDYINGAWRSRYVPVQIAQ